MARMTESTAEILAGIRDEAADPGAAALADGT
jgi:hypothetical protein